MDFPKAVKHMMIDADMTQVDIANKLNISKQNFYALLQKQDFRLNADIINIADILGYDVRLTFVNRKTQDTIECK
jgi:predicted transcriptional regulator